MPPEVKSRPPTETKPPFCTVSVPAGTDADKERGRDCPSRANAVDQRGAVYIPRKTAPDVDAVPVLVMLRVPGDEAPIVIPLIDVKSPSLTLSVALMLWLTPDGSKLSALLRAT